MVLGSYFISSGLYTLIRIVGGLETGLPTYSLTVFYSGNRQGVKRKHFQLVEQFDNSEAYLCVEEEMRRL